MYFLFGLFLTQLPFLLFVLYWWPGWLSWFGGGSVGSSPVKGILLVRNDLKMGKGKIVSQAMHAAFSAARSKSDLEMDWARNGFKKVSLKVDSLEMMDDLLRQFKNSKIPFVRIVDAGRTQIAPNTPTVAFVGPWYEEEIDRISGKLTLL